MAAGKATYSIEFKNEIHYKRQSIDVELTQTKGGRKIFGNQSVGIVIPESIQAREAELEAQNPPGGDEEMFSTLEEMVVGALGGELSKTVKSCCEALSEIERLSLESILQVTPNSVGVIALGRVVKKFIEVFEMRSKRFKFSKNRAGTKIIIDTEHEQYVCTDSENVVESL